MPQAPQEPDEDKSLIQKNGLSGWEDKNMITRVYFYPQKSGKMTVSVKIKAPQNSSRIRISLDNSGSGFDLNINPSTDFKILTAGDITIDSPRYHYLEIRGLSKTGKYFRDIDSVLLSGYAAQDLKFNTSEFRGAASTHLRY
jgi:hypothetical protein